MCAKPFAFALVIGAGGLATGLFSSCSHPMNQYPFYSQGYGPARPVRPLPNSLLDSNQGPWINPVAMQALVSQTIWNDYTIDVTNSFAVKSVYDNSVSLPGGFDRFEGEWVTLPGPISSDLLKELRARNLQADGVNLILRVRFWTERYPGLEPPGDFWISVMPCVSGPDTSSKQEILRALFNVVTTNVCARLAQSEVDPTQ
jgi:hypothetical protein